MKVFGIGLNKTGTTTLGACFKALGFRHAPYDRRLLYQIVKGDFAGARKAVAAHDSFEDWPWPLIYRELDAAYPDAKFVLTTRISAERWLDSLKNHASRAGTPKVRELAYGYATPDGHEAEHLEFYERHNREVEAHFADRPGKLLTVCWEKAGRWDELCEFLGCSAPEVDFPHANRRPGAPS